MAVAGLCMAFQAMAQDPSPGTVEYQVSAVGNASSGSFAPYFIGSNNYGITPQKGDALVNAGVFHRLDTTARWGFGYGVELIAGYGTSNRYSRYDASAGTWRLSTAGPASVKVQQLYADVRYRSLFLSVGMKQLGNVVSDDRLASGDFVHSNNARPVPQVRMGFIDFQDIPFTNGWMQVEGCFSFGKFMDDSNLEDRYNHYSYHITLGSLYHYKRIMFRTKPSNIGRAAYAHSWTCSSPPAQAQNHSTGETHWAHGTSRPATACVPAQSSQATSCGRGKTAQAWPSATAGTAYGAYNGNRIGPH